MSNYILRTTRVGVCEWYQQNCKLIKTYLKTSVSIMRVTYIQRQRCMFYKYYTCIQRVPMILYVSWIPVNFWIAVFLWGLILSFPCSKSVSFTHAHARRHTHTCMHACMHASKHEDTQTCTHIHIYTYAHKHNCVRIYTIMFVFMTSDVDICIWFLLYVCWGSYEGLYGCNTHVWTSTIYIVKSVPCNMAWRNHRPRFLPYILND